MWVYECGECTEYGAVACVIVNFATLRARSPAPSGLSRALRYRLPGPNDRTRRDNKEHHLPPNKPPQIIINEHLSGCTLLSARHSSLPATAKHASSIVSLRAAAPSPSSVLITCRAPSHASCTRPSSCRPQSPPRSATTYPASQGPSSRPPPSASYPPLPSSSRCRSRAPTAASPPPCPQPPPSQPASHPLQPPSEEARAHSLPS